MPSAPDRYILDEIYNWKRSHVLALFLNRSPHLQRVTYFVVLLGISVCTSRYKRILVGDKRAGVNGI